jgi:hypothetical protein
VTLIGKVRVIMRKVFLSVALAAMASLSYSAQWSATGATAAQNANATVSVRLAGDGITAGSQIMMVVDESRLELLSVTARNGGTCSINSSSRVIVLSPIVATVIPNAATSYCDLNLRVRANAVQGAANVQGMSALCYAGSGSTVANCTVVNNVVTVTGIRPASITAPIVQRKILLALLSGAQNATTVEQLTGYNFAAGAATAPLQALRQIPARKAACAAGRLSYCARIRIRRALSWNVMWLWSTVMRPI